MDFSSFKYWSSVARSFGIKAPKKPTESRKRKRSRKLSKKQKRQKVVRKTADHLKKDGWVRLEPSPIRFKEQEVMSKVIIDNTERLSPLDCFKKLWNDDIHRDWLLLVRTHVRHDYKATRDNELRATGWKYLGFYFNLMARPAPSLRENFSRLGVLKNHELYLNLHAARGSMDPFTLARRLSDNFIGVLRLGSHLSIDEIIAESSIDSPAVSNVPRKPHPDGVLMWGAGVKVQRDAPFVARIIVKTEEYLDWKTHNVVEKLISPLKVTHKLNFTMDSWFDSAAVKEYINLTGHFYTIGAHQGREKPFWEWAKDGILPNEWRQFSNDSAGVMASVFSDTSLHCCTSTAYRPVHQINQNLERAPLSDVYKAHFNYIDLFDRNFYKFSMPHRTMSINDVLFDALIHVTLINAMVLHNAQEAVEPINFQDWTLTVCNEILGL